MGCLDFLAVLADRLAQFMHYFTLYASLRPFGASAVVAGYDPFSGNHELYMVEPSGTNYVSRLTVTRWEIPFLTLSWILSNFRGTILGMRGRDVDQFVRLYSSHKTSLWRRRCNFGYTPFRICV